MINPKIVILIAFITYQLDCGLSEEWPSPKLLEKTQPVIDKCSSETGVDKAFLDSVRKGNLEENDQIKSYLLCVFKTFDLIDYKHHDFEYWKILGMLPQEMKKPVFEMGRGCLHIKGEDYPKASLDFVKCLYKANANHFAFLF